MSNTYRKDRNGKTFKEGLKKKCGRTRCRCEYCMDVEQNKLIDKIAEKELKTELKSDGYYYDDNSDVENYYKFYDDLLLYQGIDEIITKKYLINYGV